MPVVSSISDGAFFVLLVETRILSFCADLHVVDLINKCGAEQIEADLYQNEFTFLL